MVHLGFWVGEVDAGIAAAFTKKLVLKVCEKNWQ